jgi:hypothetical protein
MRTIHEDHHSLDSDVGGEREEEDRDQELGSALRLVRAASLTGEEPDHDEAREHFDQAVRTEPDQRDRARSDPCTDRDRELDDVSTDPAPGEQAGAALEPVTVERRRQRDHAAP